MKVSVAVGDVVDVIVGVVVTVNVAVTDGLGVCVLVMVGVGELVGVLLGVGVSADKVGPTGGLPGGSCATAVGVEMLENRDKQAIRKIIK